MGYDVSAWFGVSRPEPKKKKNLSSKGSLPLLLEKHQRIATNITYIQPIPILRDLFASDSLTDGQTRNGLTD